MEEATGEIVYTVRAESNRFRAPVYATGKYILKVGRQKADAKSFGGLTPVGQQEQTTTLKASL